VPESLNLLLVEDSEDDAMLTLRELSRGGFYVHHCCVHDADSLRAALMEQPWDLVISDYHLPGFSGEQALELVRECDSDIPFIIVSGAIDQETAVAMMRAGAHDYIMKDNLTRLLPATERELREAAVRRAQHAAEAYLRLAAKVFEGSIEGIVITDAAARILRVNQAFTAITGYAEAEVIGKRMNLLQSGRHDEAY